MNVLYGYTLVALRLPIQQERLEFGETVQGSSGARHDLGRVFTSRDRRGKT